MRGRVGDAFAHGFHKNAGHAGQAPGGVDHPDCAHVVVAVAVGERVDRQVRALHDALTCLAVERRLAGGRDREAFLFLVEALADPPVPLPVFKAFGDALGELLAREALRRVLVPVSHARTPRGPARPSGASAWRSTPAATAEDFSDSRRASGSRRRRKRGPSFRARHSSAGTRSGAGRRLWAPAAVVRI